jgi:Uma2 family endonuclease
LELLPTPGTAPPETASADYARLRRLIADYAEPRDLGATYGADTGFRIARDPDTVLAPDVAFVSRDRLPESQDGYYEGPPDLAVEVVSPNDRVRTVEDKAAAWLAAGARAVWVVWPNTRTVTVHRPGRKPHTLREEDTLTGEDILPGFACPVAKVFGK